MEIETYAKTALVYAYRTRDAEKWGIDPKKISLAYQVDQPLATCQKPPAKAGGVMAKALITGVGVWFLSMLRIAHAYPAG